MGFILIQYAIVLLVAVVAATVWRDRYRNAVITVIEAAGICEAALGLLQVFSLAPRKHGIFAITGTFDNPGPFGGFVALVAAVSLSDFLFNRHSRNFRLLFGISCFIICLIALVASMSRTAWIAFCFSAVFILARDVCFRNHFATSLWRPLIILIVALICMAGMILLKKDSAIGRIHIWHMELLAIAEKPLTGYGFGNELGAYGAAQHDYFERDHRSNEEKEVAGSPEYAFNEYLGAAESGGIGLFLLMIAVLTFSICRLRGSPLQSGIRVLAIFSFASYPLSLPEFRIVLTLILGACFFDITKPFWKFFLPPLLGFFTVIAIAAYPVANKNHVARGSVINLYYSSSGMYYSGLEDELAVYSDIMENDYRFLYEYGWALSRAGRYEDSNAVLTKGIKKSSDPMFYNLMGINYWACGNYEEASSCFTYASFMVPSRLFPHVLQMEMALDYGKVQDAIIISENIMSLPINLKNHDMVALREKAAVIIDALKNRAD